MTHLLFQTGDAGVDGGFEGCVGGSKGFADAAGDCVEGGLCCAFEAFLQLLPLKLAFARREHLCGQTFCAKGDVSYIDGLQHIAGWFTSGGEAVLFFLAAVLTAVLTAVLHVGVVGLGENSLREEQGSGREYYDGREAAHYERRVGG